MSWLWSVYLHILDKSRKEQAGTKESVLIQISGTDLVDFLKSIKIHSTKIGKSSQ